MGGSSGYRFVFAQGSGHDGIRDFADDIDRLDLRASGFANLAAVQAQATDSGAGLVIDLGDFQGSTVTLSGFTLAQVAAADVLIQAQTMLFGGKAGPFASLYADDCDESDISGVRNHTKGLAFCREKDDVRRAKREMTTLCDLTASVLDHLTTEPGHRKRADGI